MPTGASPASDSAFNGIDAFPDGTLVVRSLNRPVGCTLNGYSAAAYKCPGAPDSAKPSIIGTVDSKTFKVLSWTQLKGNVLGRVTTGRHQGHDYAYTTTPTQIFRYVWDGHTIKQDTTWGPVTYAKPGQTQAGAPVITGDWVVFSTNGTASKVPLSVVAIHQGSSKRITRLSWSTTHPDCVAEAGGGAARHTRAWSVGAPVVVAGCRWLRFVPLTCQMQGSATFPAPRWRGRARAPLRE